MEQRPLLVTSEEDAKLPILIVDKKGEIGTSLTRILRDQFLVVIVTAENVERHDNVVHIPYRRKIPLIPDNAYSHLFIIYNGEKELLEMLSPFEEKAAAVKARVLFITSLLYSTPQLFTRLQKPEHQSLQKILFGESFDNAIREANEINFFIHQARVYGRIELPGEGLGTLYPILLDDVLTAIVSLAFAIEKREETIFLFPHHDNKEVTIARVIQKIDPMIKVDFTKRKSGAKKYYIPSGGLYYFRNYNLEEKFHKIDYSRLSRRAKLPQKKINLRIPDYEVNKTRMRLFWATFLAVFIAPLVMAFVSAFAGAGMLAFSAQQLESGGLQIAQTSAAAAQGAFSITQVLAPSLLLPQLLIPQQKAQFLTMMQTGQTVATTEISFIQALQTMKNIYDKKSSDPKNDFLQAVTTIKNVLVTMQQLEAERSLPTPVVSKIHELDSMINLVEETIDTWPTIFGFNGKKTYLVLFQNNMELRPGGGFIGSFGILSVENGTLDKLQIHDVYDADGQLTESIEPPYGLLRYLGASHWFLRDSNFDPDFTTDAKQAGLFLQKETKQKVDGVIAIDTTFLKNLLAVVGSVYLTDYKVTVTPDNFYLLTETNAEKNFFPGSTQKKDFLRSLTTALVDKLSSQRKMPYQKLAQLLVTTFQQKDLLMAFSDNEVQNVFTVNDLSSSLWDDRVAQKNTAYDFFGIVDANVGTNKTNYYVKRSVTQSTILNDVGELQTTADVTYTNTSNNGSSFGGDYKDYVRFLLPANTTLVSVAFDKKAVQVVPAITDPAVFRANGFIPPPGLEVEESEEEGKSVFGFFFIVPQGTTRTVSITYRSPSGVDENAIIFNYNLLLFKQPGAGNDPYQLSLSYPNDFTVVANDKEFTNVGGKLVYSAQFSQDKTLTAQFSKK